MKRGDSGHASVVVTQRVRADARSPDKADVAEVFDFGIRPRDYMGRLGWSTFTIVLSRAKGVITLPLALLILGADGYGVVTVALTVGSALATLTLLNIPDGVTRLIVGSDPARAEARLARVRLISKASALGLALAAGITGIYFRSEVAAWALVTAAAGVVFKGGVVHMQYFQLTRRLARYTLVAQYTASAVSLPSALWFGPSGYLAANAAVLAVVAIPAWRSISVRVVAGNDRQFWRPAIRLSLQLLPASLAEWALFSIDAVIVYNVLGSGPAGAYSVAYSIAAIGLVVPLALGSVWPQTAQRLLALGHNRWRTALLRLSVIVVALGGGLVLAAIVAEPLIGAVLQQAVYADVPVCIAWVMGGFTMLGVARLFEGSLYAAGRASSILLGYAIATALNIVLNLVWIPMYGILGAAYATTLSYSALAAILFLAMSVSPPTTEDACAS